MSISLTFPDSTYTTSNKPSVETLKSDLSIIETEANTVDTAISSAITTVLEAIYPVGSVFISASDTMPSTISDLGTWARIEGKMIVGASDTDGDFDNGDTGGAKTKDVSHTHTGPSHNHSGPSHTHTGPSHTHSIPELVRVAGDHGTAGFDLGKYYTQGATTGSSGTGNTGSGGTGNTGSAGTGNTSSNGSATQDVMNPFKAKYMWERTA